MYGIHWGFLWVQCVSLAFLLAWPVLSILALITLRNRRLKEIAEAIWALVIVLVPLLGAVAFWIISPRNIEGAKVD